MCIRDRIKSVLHFQQSTFLLSSRLQPVHQQALQCRFFHCRILRIHPQSELRLYQACLLYTSLSLRERFQPTFDGHRDEFRLRSRAKFAYDIPKCKLEPYASAEMYNGLNKTEHFGVKRMRYRGGITLPLSERWEADIFYCRQWEKDKRKDIVGVECVYSF